MSHAETADRLASSLAAVAVPVLAAFGGQERTAEADLAAIREHATAAPSIATEIIADANHFYDEREAALAQVIARWVGAR